MGTTPSFEFSEIKDRTVHVVRVKDTEHVLQIPKYEDDPNDGYWTVGYIEFQFGSTSYTAYTTKDYRHLANKTFVVRAMYLVKPFWFYCPKYYLSIESDDAEGEIYNIRLSYPDNNYSPSAFLTKQLADDAVNEVGVNEKTCFQCLSKISNVKI